MLRYSTEHRERRNRSTTGGDGNLDADLLSVCKNDAACSGFPIRNKDGALLPLRAPDGSIRGMSPPHTLDETEDHPNMTCFRNGPTVINNHYMCDVTSAYAV